MEKKFQIFERFLGLLLIALALIFMPWQAINQGYSPTDDANRHIAFAMTNQTWSDVLQIEPGFEADHNAGWHDFLKFIQRKTNLTATELLNLCVVGLFFLFNITGAILSPNIAAWLVVLILEYFAYIHFYSRFLTARPFIFSCVASLIILHLWFNPDSRKKFSKGFLYCVTLLSLTLAVWLHGSWYILLLFPFALLLSNHKIKALELTLLIVLATILGSLLTGDFNGFLNFHFSATLNIFTEKLYNWQLVTEFAEGNHYIAWIFVAFLILFPSIISKKNSFNELTRNPLFIYILLCWLLSIKVIRFWSDWGNIALMYWLSYEISMIIEKMQTIKKAFFRWFLFAFLVGSTIYLFILSNKDCKKARQADYADFTNPQIAEFAPDKGGIVYNDRMTQFYFQYFENPNADWKYVLGFEPAIMPKEDRETFRNIVYSAYHPTAYKPWIKKLTPADRIFANIDLSKNYPELVWIRAAKSLWIGKLPNQKEE